MKACVGVAGNREQDTAGYPSYIEGNHELRAPIQLFTTLYIGPLIVWCFRHSRNCTKAVIALDADHLDEIGPTSLNCSEEESGGQGFSLTLRENENDPNGNLLLGVAFSVYNP